MKMISLENKEYQNFKSLSFFHFGRIPLWF